MPVSYVPPASVIPSPTAQALPIAPAVALSRSLFELNIEHHIPDSVGYAHAPQQIRELFWLFLHFSITIYTLAFDQLADIPPNDIGFDSTHPHVDSYHDFFLSHITASPPPSQYIHVEPEEEGMYGGEGDTTVRAQGTDILRMLKLYRYEKHINL